MATTPRNWRRLALKIVLVLGALFVGAFAVFALWLGPPMIKKAIETEGTAALGTPVRVESVAWKLTALAFEARGLSVTEEDGQALVKIGSIVLDVDLGDAIAGKIGIDRLEIDGLQVRLVKKPDGAWNYERFLAAEEVPTESGEHALFPVALRKFDLTKVSVIVVDQSVAGSAPQQFGPLGLSGKEIELEESGRATFDFAIDIADRSKVALRGSADLKKRDGKARLALENFNLDDVKPFAAFAPLPAEYAGLLKGLALKTSGTIDLEGDATGKLKASGNWGLENFALELNGQPALSMGQLKLAGIQFDSATGKFASQVTVERFQVKTLPALSEYMPELKEYDNLAKGLSLESDSQFEAQGDLEGNLTVSGKGRLSNFRLANGAFPAISLKAVSFEGLNYSTAGGPISAKVALDQLRVVSIAPLKTFLADLDPAIANLANNTTFSLSGDGSVTLEPDGSAVATGLWTLGNLAVNDAGKPAVKLESLKLSDARYSATTGRIQSIIALEGLDIASLRFLSTLDASLETYRALLENLTLAANGEGGVSGSSEEGFDVSGNWSLSKLDLKQNGLPAIHLTDAKVADLKANSKSGELAAKISLGRLQVSSLSPLIGLSPELDAYKALLPNISFTTSGAIDATSKQVGDLIVSGNWSLDGLSIKEESAAAIYLKSVGIKDIRFNLGTNDIAASVEIAGFQASNLKPIVDAVPELSDYASIAGGTTFLANGSAKISGNLEKGLAATGDWKIGNVSIKEAGKNAISISQIQLANARYDMATGQASSDLALEGMRVDSLKMLTAFSPDLKLYEPVLAGTTFNLTTQSRVTADLNAGQYDLVGELTVVDLNLKRPGSSASSLETKRIRITNAGYGAKGARIESIQVDEPYIAITRDATGVGLLGFPELAETTEPTIPAEPSTPIFIDSITVSKGRSQFEDRTLREPFKLALNEITISGRSIDTASAKPSVFDFKARPGDNPKSLISAKAEVSLLDPNSLTIAQLDVQDFELKAASSYLGQYIGQNAISGFAQVSTKYETRGGKLVSVNRLTLTEVQLQPARGAQGGGLLGILPLDLNATLGKLRNSKGEIVLELPPIEGNLSDPNFSYVDAVIAGAKKILGKAAQKAVLSALLEAKNPTRSASFEAGSTKLNESLVSKLQEAAQQTNQFEGSRLLIISLTTPNDERMLKRAVLGALLSGRISKTLAAAPNLDTPTLLSTFDPETYRPAVNNAYRQTFPSRAPTTSPEAPQPMTNAQAIGALASILGVKGFEQPATSAASGQLELQEDALFEKEGIVARPEWLARLAQTRGEIAVKHLTETVGMPANRLSLTLVEAPAQANSGAAGLLGLVAPRQVTLKIEGPR